MFLFHSHSLCGVTLFISLSSAKRARMPCICSRHVSPAAQILSSNPAAPLSLVREYILKRLGAEVDAVKDDERLIKQYRDDTENNRKTIEK